MKRILNCLMLASFCMACTRQLPIVDDELPQDETDERDGQARPPVIAALDNTEPDYEAPKPIEYLRVDLMRDGTAVRLLKLERMSTSLRPPPCLSAQYLLVAHAGTKAVAAIPVGFPDSVESFFAPTQPHVRKPVESAHAAVFLEYAPEIDALAILDADGAVQLEISGDELAALAKSEPATPPGIGKQAQPLTGDAFALLFPHVRVLHEGDDSLVPAQLLESGRVMNPDEQLMSQLAAGMKTLPPALQSAVQTVVMVSHPSQNATAANWYLADADAWTSGSMLIFNIPQAQSVDPRVLMHEAAHAFNFLMQPAAERITLDDRTGFAPEVVSQAQQVIDRYHLGEGLTRTWDNLHQTAVDFKVFPAYRGASYFLNGGTWTGIHGPDVGTATEYGLTSALEDFAEYVAEAGLNPKSEICRAVYMADISDKNAGIMVAKLMLARGVGAISDQAAWNCFGGMFVEPSHSGISFNDVSGAVITFGTSTMSRSTTSSFEITASGPQGYRTRISLAFEGKKAGSILGLHKIDDTVFGTPKNLVALFNDQEDLATRGSEDGLALFTTHTTQDVVGVIYGLRMQNYMGRRTDSFPLVTIKLP